ncbi:type II secretion system protein [Caloramator sp. Dgby_cultured_2]|uniref:type II secretion system protein n=1 Tax=Caloramator sp. Dgby_cultured_2 TaxID=3029174 RepID=UPI00237E330D|nr:type II secretion system protein [Caloramator sp. Dgby_cultured_2]WDU82653.1 type II secretion system protein [Caloramator sp. Dgby_cultured_2]
MKKKGFTLLEMIIVISIIALLVGIVTPQITKAMKKSKAMADVVTANTIAATIQEMMLEGITFNETTEWKELNDANFFPSGSNLSLSKFIENFSTLKPKMNSNYVFCYIYDSANNKLEIGAGKPGTDGMDLAFRLYPTLDPAYK